MPRAIWTGSLSFGLVNIPIEVHTAVRDHRPHFRMLHAKDNSPINFERICQKDGKAVAGLVRDDFEVYDDGKRQQVDHVSFGTVPVNVMLALDTSTPVLSAALVEWSGGALTVLSTRQVGPPEITSTVVPGLFDELLSEAGRSIDQLQAVVTGVGPGLFTGARVAVATMKAIAYARQLPLVGGGSLEAMALGAARGSALAKGDVTFEYVAADGWAGASPADFFPAGGCR